MEIRRIPATQLSNPATREIIYTPPVGEALIREKLANWERFIHEHADHDPLVRMGITVRPQGRVPTGDKGVSTSSGAHRSMPVMLGAKLSAPSSNSSI